MSASALPFVECARCREPIAGARPDDPPDGRVPCSRCGGTGRLVHVFAHDTVEFHERADVKARRAGPGRPYLEMRIGDDFNRDTGTWWQIRRLIDRAKNRYVETLTDADGVVVRDVDVPLDEHLGHGSDTTRPKAHP